MTIAPPVVLVDRDEVVYLFDSVEEAAGDLDRDDVPDGEYVAYDSRGPALAVEPSSGRSFSAVFRPAEAVPTHAEELRTTLLAALARRGVDVVSYTLPDVLEAALAARTGHALS